MNVIKIIRDWRKQSMDPVKNCKVYLSVGCSHVDGYCCDMRTCDIVVEVKITPQTVFEEFKVGAQEL